MPWYWSDEIARVLVELGKIDLARAATLTRAPVAYRSDSQELETAALALLDDDEIPLAA